MGLHREVLELADDSDTNPYSVLCIDIAVLQTEKLPSSHQSVFQKAGEKHPRRVLHSLNIKLETLKPRTTEDTGFTFYCRANTDFLSDPVLVKSIARTW